MPRKEVGDAWHRSKCLSSESNWGEGVRTVKPVYVGELLRMSGDTIKSVFPVHLVGAGWGREECFVERLEREICPRAVLE